jgi:alkanesulfonate monooxygenase SsuD/methylene tetrahydromethanopterin reductase-like flavin-dependent oxidoreductase (luciferase family)
MRLSIGFDGSLDARTVRELAVAADNAGVHALWLNDTPDGDSLAGLAAAAHATTALRLGVGVIPVDRVEPSEIVERVEQLDLPQERLLLGIGSGASPHPLPLVGAAVDALRGRLGSQVLVGALGPRMRSLAAQAADGAVLNWLTPETADAAREGLRQDAEDAGRPAPRSVLYVRTIVDPEDRAALDEQVARYAAMPSYARNFARAGIDPADTVIDGSDPGALEAGIARYADTVDELVLRAVVASREVDEYLAFLERVADVPDHMR